MTRYIADDLEISSDDSDDEYINNFPFKHNLFLRRSIRLQVLHHAG